MARVHIPNLLGSLTKVQARFVLIAALATGCSASDTGSAPSIVTVPVQGKVSVAGTPAAGGIITLEPLVDGGSVTQAMGEVQDDGSFQVTSAGGQAGATPGKYRVKLEPKTPIAKPKRKGSRTEVIVEVAEGKALDINIP